MKGINVKRRAFLLCYYLNDVEKYQVEADFGLVTAFLKSAEGGCFEEDEIIRFQTSNITKDELLSMIQQVDYSFIYFTGHSHFENRLIYLPMQNGEYIRESELIVKGKKQWIFFDTCRSNDMNNRISNDAIPRLQVAFTKPNSQALKHWQDACGEVDSFYLICYSTELGSKAYSNENGGLGTQLFFSVMHHKLLNKEKFNTETLLNDCSVYDIPQRISFINGNGDLKRFPICV